MALALAALALATQAGSGPTAAERAAIFTAAGFVRRGPDWRTRDCQDMEGASYAPGTIEQYRDLNGDGRADAVVSETSAICYGMTGSRFWLLSRRPDGRWQVLASDIGVPEFLPTKGVGGWPDLSVGGPGFCFPVLRWNSRAYAHHRFEYEGKRCSPPEP